MNKQKIIGALKTCDIQNNINGFVEDVIFEFPKHRQLISKSGITFNQAYTKIILERAYAVISPATIKVGKIKADLVSIYEKNVYPLLSNNTINNITSEIIDPSFTLFDSMFNSTVLGSAQKAGILQKYNNMVQKYLFCIGNYTGSVINISTQIKTDALTLIKNKYLDCPIDNIILQNVIDYDFINNFIHKPIKISKNYIQINGFTWSRLDKGLYNEIVIGISDSCKEILTLAQTGSILTFSNNAKYLNNKKSKFINNGLLFDLLFWTRNSPKLNKKMKKGKE